MLNGLIGDFINAALSAHMTEIQKTAVSSKLLNNSLSISELELYKFSLLQHQVPMIVNKGIIRNISIQIPFTGSQKGPAVISISDVAIIATLCLGDPHHVISEEDLFSLREHQLEAHELFKKKYSSILKILPMDKLSTISKKTLMNLTILIENFHFRIELSNGRTIGLYSEKIEFKSITVNNEIVQTVSLPGFCVYFDFDSKPVNRNSNDIFISEMRKLRKSNHRFIVPPFDFVASVSNDDVMTHLESILEKININISNDQIPTFAELSIGASIFMKKFEYIQIPRNDNDPMKMWLYFHEVAKKKLKSPYQRFINAMHKLIDRQQYIKLWGKEKKKTRTRSLIELDHRLDFRTVILFRSIAETTSNKKKKNKIDSIINWVEMDPILLISGKIRAFDLHAFAETICLTFSRNDFGARTILINPEIKFSTNDNLTNISVILSSFNIEYLKGAKVSSLLKSIYNEKKTFTAKITLKSKKNHVVSSSVDVISEPVDFCVDVPHILELVSNLDLSAINTWKMGTQPKDFNFNMEMNMTKFLWVFSETKSINFGFEKFGISTNEPNSAKFSIENVEVASNHSIIENLTVSGYFTQNDMSILIKKLNFNIGNEEVEMIKPLIDYSMMLDRSVPNKVPKVALKIVSVEGESNFIPDQKIDLNNVSILIDIDEKGNNEKILDNDSSEIVSQDKTNMEIKENNSINETLSIENNSQLKQSICFDFDSFSIENFVNLKKFKLQVDNQNLVVLKLSSFSLKISDLPEFEIPELDPTSTTKMNDFKVKLLVSELKLNFFEVDVMLTNLAVSNTDIFSFKFDSIYSSLINFSENSSIAGTFIPDKNYFELTMNFDSIYIDIDNLLEALTIPSKKRSKKLIRRQSSSALTFPTLEKSQTTTQENKNNILSPDKQAKIISEMENEEKNLIKQSITTSTTTENTDTNNKNKINEVSTSELANENIVNKKDKINNSNETLNETENKEKKTSEQNNKKKEPELSPETNLHSNKFILPINFKFKAPMFPLTIKQGNRQISCGTDLSISISDDQTMNIKLRRCFFSLNTAMIFENMNVALYRAPTSKLTIALNENTVHLSLRLLEQLIDMFSEPSFTKFNPADVICDFDIVIPKIEIDIHAQRSDKLGIKLFVIPITDTRIHSHNLLMKYTTTFSIESILSPLQSEQIVSQTIFAGKSLLSDIIIKTKMSFKTPMDIFVSPNSLNAILNFKKDSEMDSDFLFVNQTSMLIDFVVDNKKITVYHNSTMLNQHIPINPKIEINFPHVNEKNQFDISLLRRETAYPLLVDGGYVMIQLTARSLILSSVLSFKNSTSIKLILDIPEMGKIEIEKGDTYFIAPRFCQIRYITLYDENNNYISFNILDKNQEIRLKNHYFIVKYGRDPITLVSTVSFNAPFYLQSFYPYKMQVKVISPKEKMCFPVFTFELYPIDIFPPNSGKIELEITAEDRIHTTILNIKTTTDFSILKTESEEEDLPIYLCCQIIKKEDINCRILQLSAELFLFNQLDVQLGIVQDGMNFSNVSNMMMQKSNLFITSKIHKFSKSKSNTNYYSHSYKLTEKKKDKNKLTPFVYTSSQTESFTLKFMLLQSGKPSIDKLSINKVDSSSFITLPCSPQTDDVMPASVIVKHTQQYPNTSFMYVKPAFVIENRSKLPLFIKLSETTCGVLDFMTFLPVRSVDPSMNIEIIMLNTLVEINLLQITPFSMVLEEKDFLSMIVETNVVNHVKYITFRTEKYRRSFAFINDTNKMLIFAQQCFAESNNNYELKAYPNSTTLFDLPDTRKPYILNVKPLGIKVDLETPSNTQLLIDKESGENYYFRVEMGNYGRYIFHISSNLPEFNKKEYKQMIAFKMVSIFCHLVSHSCREICQLTINNSLVQFEQQKDDIRLNVDIGGIQIDDMNCAAVFPVVFAGFSRQEKPFFSFSYQQFSKEIIGFLSAQIQPITVKIDLSFVGDLIALFSKLNIMSSSSTSSYANFYIEEDDDYVNNNENNENNNDLSAKTEITENYNLSSNYKQKFMLQLLRIMPISVDISYSGRTTRNLVRFYSDFNFPHLVNMIPTIDSLDIYFDVLESTFLSVNLNELQMFICDHFLYSLKLQWLSVVGSFALIGSPQKLLRNFSRSFKSLISKREGKDFFKSTVGEIILTPETCMKTVSNTVRSLTDDYSPRMSEEEEGSAVGSVKWGAKSFAHGLSRAITGVVTRPIDKRGEGMGGILKGVGEGIFGVVTNSVGGALDLGSGVLGGVRKGLFGEYTLHRVSNPVSFSDNNNSSSISNGNYYSHNCNSNNNLNSNSNNNNIYSSMTTILYWDKDVQIFTNKIHHTESGRSLMIKEIKRIEKERNQVKLIELNDKVNISLKFKNENMAAEFCDVIETQKERNNLIQFMEFLHPIQ